MSPLRATPPEVQFGGDMRGAAHPPHIFLFVIDSLRRDYVSPYNPAVTFTPEIARFASDSFIFERAFTRYAGTGLAVPSIWAGSMLLHTLDQRPFDGRNALLKLLDADGYRRVMSVDHIMRDLLPPADPDDELDRGVPPMECEFCRTLRQLEARLARSPEDSRPIFSYTLPQNVHIAVASRRTVPADYVYPGFFAPVAESVRQVDTCFGEFWPFSGDRLDDTASSFSPRTMATHWARRDAGATPTSWCRSHADSTHHACAAGVARSRPRISIASASRPTLRHPLRYWVISRRTSVRCSARPAGRSGSRARSPPWRVVSRRVELWRGVRSCPAQRPRALHV